MTHPELHTLLKVFHIALSPSSALSMAYLFLFTLFPWDTKHIFTLDLKYQKTNCTKLHGSYICARRLRVCSFRYIDLNSFQSVLTWWVIDGFSCRQIRPSSQETAQRRQQNYQNA